AQEGFIYVRNEYPMAREKLARAIEQAREYGLLGENILDLGFNFDVHLHRGAGAFVCGEETALINSIEGKPGEPQTRPPYPVESGLWKRPTVINNVETWANVAVIINRGAKWYSKIGTVGSKGTKVFSVVGKVIDTGLVEVPMGTTLGEIIFDICGGIPGDRKYKAVQIGGPSGGCLSASHLNYPVDYESLIEAGSIMGSGGMVVMDENTCMVDLAKFFLTFTKDESCGKCTPCREGIPRMLEILAKITEGRGEMDDLTMLEVLATTIKATALCGLGNTAPNPVLSTLRYFRNEYENHIKYKKCDAAVCKQIISSPCHHTCPIGTDVPSYIALIAQGHFDEAFDVIWEENPLPSICGRVCNHPCEVRCRSGDIDKPIAIRDLKRFVCDHKNGRIRSFPTPTKKYEKVAIIGSGPAGLVCGWELAKLGYKPTIFEALPVAGGMLAVAIPEYRLPKDILNEEIEGIKKAGVEIITNLKIGKDKSIDDLFNESYKAVFIATGAHNNLKLKIPGEDAEGVIDPIEFLRKVALGEDVKIGKKVVVIGGGDTAIDSARAVLRMGADVTIVYRRTRIEMPAAAEEIEAAMEEGIQMHFLATPVEVISKNGRLAKIKCVNMSLGEFDKGGRRRPIPEKGTEFEIECDTFIPAIGQKPDLSFVKNGKLKTSKWNTLVVNSETLETDQPRIFAGGDVVSGPATVIEAMAAGKKAAVSIHKYLRGESLERTYEVTKPTREIPAVALTEDELVTLKRPTMPFLSMDERKSNFKEVEQGFTKEIAIQEAKRCLRCDLE
ncbi:MAG: FAD-dependent oxidoreductase, partial [Deltaproteobacteria bacterium]|nr:FAD-dependent oxidoreductase [Deltaproteobacteria bacterium]